MLYRLKSWNFSDKENIVSLVLLCLFFVPILITGLYTDDRFNYFIYQFVDKSQFFCYLFTNIIRSIVEQFEGGRFLPIATIQLHVSFGFFNTLFAYKLYVFVMNILALSSFLLLLKKLLNKKIIPLFIIFFIAHIAFFINNHDAFTSLNAMMQLTAIFIFLSLYFLFIFFEKPTTFRLIVMLLFAICSLMTYEIGIISFVILLLLQMIHFGKNVFKQKVFIYTTLTFIVMLGSILYIRNTHQIGYGGIKTNFEFVDIINAFLNHFLSGLPMMVFARVPNIVAVLKAQLSESFIQVLLSLIIIISLYLIYSIDISKCITKFSKTTNIKAYCIALCLMIFPALIISLTPKYQIPLWRIDKAYLQIYFQHFGWALVFVMLFDNFMITTKRYFLGKMILSLFLLIGICTLLLNYAMIQVLNDRQSVPFFHYIAALQNGMLNKLNPNDVIILNNDHLFQHPAINEAAFKRLYKIDINVVDKSINYKNNLLPQYFYDYSYDIDKGEIILSKMDYKKDTVTSDIVYIKKVPKTKTFLPEQYRTIWRD